MNLRPSPETKAFVADLNTVAYSSYTNQRLWLRTGHTILAAIVWALLTDNVARLQDILEFVLMWCSYLTGKSFITAGRDAVKRNTAAQYVEAKERGKAASTPAVVAQKVERVEVNTDAPVMRRKTDVPVGPSTEPNLYADDERGE